MNLPMSYIRSNRYVNTTVSELQRTNHSPIHGYEDLPVMALEQAVERIVSLVDNILQYADDAKLKCNRTANILTVDESAAIYLYTMSTPFFSRLNDTLRAEQRDALKPWFAFLKLFISALEKLPSSSVRVWRAVCGNIDPLAVEGNLRIWWSVNSCSTNLRALEAYLGCNGTLFAIDPINGKHISSYSAFPDEEEVILMPGAHLWLSGDPLNFNNLLRVVALEEKPRNEHPTPRLVHVNDLLSS